MRATLLIGGNIGSRNAYLDFAISHLKKSIGSIVKRSDRYESEAWGDRANHPFLNQVVEVETTLQPNEILKRILSIELMADRTRIERWGDRTLDIDVLFLENQTIEAENLTVPHPRIAERKFTLIPLNDIDPNFIHPVLQKSIATLLEECTDNLNVNKYPY